MISLMLGALLLVQGAPEEEFLSKIPYQITYQIVQRTPSGDQTFSGTLYKLGNNWKMVTDLGEGLQEILLVKDGKVILVSPGEDSPVEQIGHSPRSILDFLGIRATSPRDSVIWNTMGLPVEIFRSNGEHVVIREYRRVEGLGWIPMQIETYLEDQPVSVLKITGVSQAEFSSSVFEPSTLKSPQRASDVLQQRLGITR